MDQNPVPARFLSRTIRARLCTTAYFVVHDRTTRFLSWFWTLVHLTYPGTYIYSMVHTISFATAHAHFSNELLLRIIQNGMIRKESDLCEFYNPSSLCHQIWKFVWFRSVDLYKSCHYFTHSKNGSIRKISDVHNFYHTWCSQ